MYWCRIDNIFYGALFKPHLLLLPAIYRQEKNIGGSHQESQLSLNINKKS